jgi:hypothetical protein
MRTTMRKVFVAALLAMTMSVTQPRNAFACDAAQHAGCVNYNWNNCVTMCYVLGTAGCAGVTPICSDGECYIGTYWCL